MHLQEDDAHDDDAKHQSKGKHTAHAAFEDFDPFTGLIVVAYEGDDRTYGPGYFTPDSSEAIIHALTRATRFTIDGKVTPEAYPFVMSAIQHLRRSGCKAVLVKAHPTLRTEFIIQDRLIEIKLRHILEIESRSLFIQHRGTEVWIFDSIDLLSIYPYPFTSAFRRTMALREKLESDQISESKILRHLSLDLRFRDSTDRQIMKEIFRQRLVKLKEQLYHTLNALLRR